MLKDYEFRDIITALTHFTMFGWEKEANILFDFMVKHLDDNIVEVNEWDRHV
jgi:hypothetical protein